MSTKKEPQDPMHQSAFSRAINSIRTRYSLMTAAFLLMVLGMFYVGGRIVLIHLVRDAENQVKEIGTDIRSLAYRNADKVRLTAVSMASEYGEAARKGSSPQIASLLGGSPRVTLAARFLSDGTFAEGAALTSEGCEALSASDFSVYSKHIAGWMRSLTNAGNANSVGIVRVRGVSRYVAATRFAGEAEDGFLILGQDFDSNVFTSQVNESFAGLDIKISNRRAEISAKNASPADGGKGQTPQKFGIVPMLDEAIDFYSGGFWNLNSNPFEAVFAIRDIAGNAVSMIAVSLPKSFSSVTSIALGRLTFFITLGGIFLVIPLFWLQGRVLLNPITEMTKRMRDVCMRHNDTDCPRLEWHSKDEFALLAISVNEMLETLSRRSLAVAQIESRQRALIDGLPDGLAVFELSRRTLVTITKQPEGVDPLPGLETGSGADPAVYGQRGAQAFDNALATIAKNGVIQNLRLSAVRRDAPPRCLEVRISKMDEHFALASFRDITAEVTEHAQRLAAESRLHQTQKQESLTALAAGIAHDVNNVLAVILNTAEITWNDSADQNVRLALATIRDAVKRGSSMARELMTFAGETKPSLKRSDPSDLVKEAQRLAQGILGSKTNVTISYDLPAMLPPVDADPNQIWKVFFNLIKNAAEAIGDRVGEVSVSTRKYTVKPGDPELFSSASPLKPGEKGVLFQFSDTGPGIPPELLRRIFDPYVSTKAQGRGLGLATVLAVISAHNGGVHVVSEIGEGTTFRIFLPESKAVGEITRRLQVLGREGEVLLVDDDPAILRTTAILLKTIKVTVHAASNRSEALAAFRNYAQSLTCVILDANIDGVDSAQLIGSFRNISPQVPVIVSSGSAPEKLKEQFADNPYEGFLAKPYTIAERQDAIARFGRKFDTP